MADWKTWTHLQRFDFGWISNLIRNLQGMEMRGQIEFDRFSGQTCHITSDYGGENAGSAFATYSFLIADLACCHKWCVLRERVRTNYLADMREMAFKSMNDGQRRSALVPFLEAADSIPGTLFTLAIDRRIRLHQFLPLRILQQRFPGVWNETSAEKFSLAVTIIGILLALHTRPHQNVHWFSDNDEINQGAKRRGSTISAFKMLTSLYLPHPLGSLGVGNVDATSEIDLKDLASISDLAAGAVSEAAGLMATDGGASTGLCLKMSNEVSQKTNAICQWLGVRRGPLQKCVCTLRTNSRGEIFLGWIDLTPSAIERGIVISSRTCSEMLRKRTFAPV